MPFGFCGNDADESSGGAESAFFEVSGGGGGRGCSGGGSKLAAAVIVAMASVSGASFSGDAVVKDAAPVWLLVEGLEPGHAVLSEQTPRFSFEHPPVPAGTYNVLQVQYRVTVAVSRGGGAWATVWDSGTVESQAHAEIEYNGEQLKPFRQYRWTVQWASASSAPSLSPPAASTFETGPMSAIDWHGASWLFGYAQARFEFQLPAAGDIEWARLYVASPGCTRPTVNGRVPEPDLRGICPWVVTPSAGGGNAADLGRNTRYQTHDVTALLSTGSANALGVLVGNVMSTENTFIAVLTVWPAAALEPLFFVSGPDRGWQVRDESFVRTGNAWIAEIDWRDEEPGWDEAHFAAGPHWTPAERTADLKYPARALQMPPSRVLNEVRPVAMEGPYEDGSVLYTFPKNFVGTVRINARNTGSGPNATLQILSGEWTSPTPPHIPPPAPPLAQCNMVPEDWKGRSVLRLGGCPVGGHISNVTFASYGTPRGSCETGFSQGGCSAPSSYNIVAAACIGTPACSVTASDDTFGNNKAPACRGKSKFLAAQVQCTPADGGVAVAMAGAVAGTSVASAIAPGISVAPLAQYPAISGNKQQLEIHHLRPGQTSALETIFCWHGFQYVLVTPRGDTGFEPVLGSITGLEINTDIVHTGDLSFGGDGVPGSRRETAAAVLNGVNSMTLASQRSNVAAYMPTDCPTREKHGWMGDALDASEEALYNFGMLPVHTAFFQTIVDNQGAGGDVPSVIPGSIPQNGSCSDIAWTSAFPLIVNMHVQYYNNTRPARRHWSALVRYTENLIGVANNSSSGLAECDQWQDWLCGSGESCCSGLPANSSCPVKDEMGSFGYVQTLRAMAQMAIVLKKAEQSRRYAGLAAAATSDFHKAFYSPQFSAYGGDDGAVQSLTVPALVIDAPPATLKPQIVKGLAYDVADVAGYTLRVGAVSSKSLLNVLSDNGHHVAALRLATTTAGPSWGNWLSRNATTCWENWNMSSHAARGSLNHIFLCGGVSEWHWKYLAGIRTTAPGFSSVAVAPRPDGTDGPSQLSARYRSRAGPITSAWNVSDNGGARINLRVGLPVGVRTATIAVPKPFRAVISPPERVCASARESGRTGKELCLKCGMGSVIENITFASFGTPDLSHGCGAYRINASCASNVSSTEALVRHACVGKNNCTLAVTREAYGPDPCNHVVKSLAVAGFCSGVGTGGTAIADKAVVTEGGKTVWDGARFVGPHLGLFGATETATAIVFSAGNGQYEFVSSRATASTLPPGNLGGGQSE